MTVTPPSTSHKYQPTQSVPSRKSAPAVRTCVSHHGAGPAEIVELVEAALTPQAEDLELVAAFAAVALALAARMTAHGVSSLGPITQPSGPARGRFGGG